MKRQRIRLAKRERSYRTTVSLTARTIAQWNEMVDNGHPGNLSRFIRDAVDKLYRETIGRK